MLTAAAPELDRLGGRSGSGCCGPGSVGGGFGSQLRRRRYQRSSGIAIERQKLSLRVIVHPHQVTAMYLVGGDQVRHRAHHGTVDRPFQMASAVTYVRAL